MRMGLMGLGLMGLVLLAACGDDDDTVAADSGATDGSVVSADGSVDAGAAFDAGRSSASATLQPKSGNTTLAGTVTWTRTGSTVQAMLSVTGAPPGMHGVHIHQVGDCSAADATSAGAHWNPTNLMHGLPGSTMQHVGDMGNLTVAADGTGTLMLSNPMWRIGDGSPGDVVGHAVVIHAMVDDGTTQPTGNSGARIGCGVIQ